MRIARIAIYYAAMAYYIRYSQPPATICVAMDAIYGI